MQSLKYWWEFFKLPIWPTLGLARKLIVTKLALQKLELDQYNHTGQPFPDHVMQTLYPKSLKSESQELQSY